MKSVKFVNKLDKMQVIVRLCEICGEFEDFFRYKKALKITLAPGKVSCEWRDLRL